MFQSSITIHYYLTLALLPFLSGQTKEFMYSKMSVVMKAFVHFKIYKNNTTYLAILFSFI